MFFVAACAAFFACFLHSGDVRLGQPSLSLDIQPPPACDGPQDPCQYWRGHEAHCIGRNGVPSGVRPLHTVAARRAGHGAYQSRIVRHWLIIGMFLLISVMLWLISGVLYMISGYSG